MSKRMDLVNHIPFAGLAVYRSYGLFLCVQYGTYTLILYAFKVMHNTFCLTWILLMY